MFSWNEKRRIRATKVVSRRCPIRSDVDVRQKDNRKDRGKDRDLDWLTNNQERDSSPRPTSPCKQYPRLREALHWYFKEPGQEDLYPSERLVVDVMDAARGATEQDVIAAPGYLSNAHSSAQSTAIITATCTNAACSDNVHDDVAEA